MADHDARREPEDARIARLARRGGPREARRTGAPPDQQEIAAFLEGALPEARRREVEAWLAADDDLRRQVFQEAGIRGEAAEQPLRMPHGLREALTARFAKGAPADLVQVVYRAARRCLEMLSPDGGYLALDPVPLRGQESNPVYRLAMGEVDVEVAVERHSGGVFEVGLRAPALVVEGRRCEWQLWSGEKLIEIQPTERGEALFGDLAAGSYRCALATEGRELGSLNLTLEAETTSHAD